jgi:predicted small lipoprotein YifL
MLHLPYSRLKWVVVLFFLVSLSVLGCGHRQGSFEKPPDDKHILKVLSIWSAYRADHNNQQPANTEALKAWAQTLPPEKKQGLGIDNLDETFTSPRDHQPYRIAPIKITGRPGPPTMTVIYESEGVDGKVMTAGGMGSVGLITKEQLKQDVPNAP